MSLQDWFLARVWLFLHRIVLKPSYTWRAGAELGGVVKLRFIASVAFLVAAAVNSASAIEPAMPVYGWAGCYVGIAGGGNWASSQVFYELQSSPAVGLAETSGINLSGGLFGGTTGCGFQVSPWVVGIENDISWTNISTAGTIPPFNPLTTFRVEENWLDTLRVRFGYGWNRWFFYGTGGGAFAGLGFTPCGPIAGCSNQSMTVLGWTAGLGVEYTFWAALSVKAEYLHADFGRQFFAKYAQCGPARCDSDRRHIPSRRELQFHWTVIGFNDGATITPRRRCIPVGKGAAATTASARRGSRRIRSSSSGSPRGSPACRHRRRNGAGSRRLQRNGNRSSAARND
jgi:outer membrane immunogenic protein